MKKASQGDADDIYLETVRKRRKPTPRDLAPRTKRFKESLDPDSLRMRFSNYMRQEIGSDGFGIIPPQYAGLTFLTLLLIVPKLLGMAFFYFYVSNGQADLYAKVHTGDLLLDWVIGYEIFAVIVLLFIGKNIYYAVFK